MLQSTGGSTSSRDKTTKGREKERRLRAAAAVPSPRLPLLCCPSSCPTHPSSPARRLVLPCPSLPLPFPPVAKMTCDSGGGLITAERRLQEDLDLTEMEQHRRPLHLDARTVPSHGATVRLGPLPRHGPPQLAGVVLLQPPAA